jgi:hypothetical protein
MNRILRVFFNSDLRGQHDGLVKVAGASNVNLLRLKHGEHVAFINRLRNKLKLFSKNGNQNVVTYLRLDKNQRLDLHCLPDLIKTFNPGGKLDYQGALKRRIEKQFVSPLLFTKKRSVQIRAH